MGSCYTYSSITMVVVVDLAAEDMVVADMEVVAALAVAVMVVVVKVVAMAAVGILVVKVAKGFALVNMIQVMMNVLLIEQPSASVMTFGVLVLLSYLNYCLNRGSNF